jgi:hypothetical protein
MAKVTHLFGVELKTPQEPVEAIRPLHVIAREIEKEWPKPYFGAVPYLQAMKSLNSIDDHYGQDPAGSIVIYFLANAKTWRGEAAKRIKAELKRIYERK